MSELTFRGQLDERAWGRVNALASGKTWAFVGIMLGALLLSNLGLRWREFAADPIQALPLVVMVVVFGLFAYPMQRLAVRRSWRGNKIMQQPVSGVVSGEGITWNIEGLSHTHYPWDLLLRYRESESLVLVYQGVNQVLYFFREYFSSEEDWSKFKSLLAQHLPCK